MNSNRVYLYEVPDRPAIYKLNMIRRTDEITGSILRPQTQQICLFFGLIKPIAKSAFVISTMN